MSIHQYLVRQPTGSWLWTDGSEAEGVVDRTPAYSHKYRFTTRYGEDPEVEIPIEMIQSDRNLKWLRPWLKNPENRPEEVYEDDSAIDGEVLVIPASMYDRWRNEEVIGPYWDSKIRANVLKKASDLGWTR